MSYDDAARARHLRTTVYAIGCTACPALQVEILGAVDAAKLVTAHRADCTGDVAAVPKKRIYA